MTSFDTLQTFSEVSVTLVGLVAVIVVLRGRTERAWSKHELYGSIHVLLPGLITMFSSLFALSLFGAYGETDLTWRVAHGAFAAFHSIGPILFFFFQDSESRGILDGRTAKVFGLVSAILICISISISAGYLLQHAPITFYLGLLWIYGANAFAFGNMLVSSSTDDA